ncbi:MAG TPA: M67 family peptidase, partial [Hadesarchaea archaeon]|nr:M67 family peptidase [Hadesarchaea archaeon]
MKLNLKKTDLLAIDAHALENFPQECCGLLFGKFGENSIEVKNAAKAENVLGSTVSFEADPEFVFKAVEHAEKVGLELVGIYHSHPNVGAHTSARDSEVMKLWPGVAWLILCVKKNQVIERKAYVLKNDDIKEM